MEFVECWKRALLTLPEDPFFTLMRTYLGSIKTPFHKPTLINELTAFISKPANKKMILDRVERADAEVLTALSLLDEPRLSDLSRFYQGSRSFFSLRSHLSNLEERLLIYLDRSGGSNRIKFNPLIKQDIEKRMISFGLLFPSLPYSGKAAAFPEPWLTDSLVIAFVSFAQKREIALTKDGSLRKSFFKELKETFPVLFSGPEDERLYVFLKVLLRTDLLTLDKNRYSPNYISLDKASGLSVEDRTRIYWGAAGSEELAVESWAFLYGEFLSALPAKRVFDRKTLESLSRAVAIRAGFNPDRPEDLLHIAIAMGHVSPLEKDNTFMLSVNPLWFRLTPGKEGVTLLPNFEITADKNISLETGIRILSLADIKKHDSVSIFEITKESVFRGFKKGCTLEELLSFLKRISKSGLPQNISFSLNQWNKEFRSLGLFEGLVLVVEEGHRHLVEHAQEFLPLINRVLGPGVYLLFPDKKDKLEKAFKAIGIEQVPETVKAGTAQKRSCTNFPLPAKTNNGSLLPKLFSPEGPEDFGSFNTAPLIESLKKMDLPEERRLDLENKINRGIILYPEQLRFVPQEKDRLEAKGLNFTGKVRLIEQAVSGRDDVLEIIERLPSGDPRHSLIRPMGLDKTGKDLYLFGKMLPDQDTVRIRVDKISLVRRIKGSPFFCQ